MRTAAAAVAARYERAGGIGRIVLDHPPLNILTLTGLAELEIALEQAAGDQHLIALCLQGEGRAFCAGVSVADHTADRVGGTLEVFGRCIRLLLGFEAPVIAAVHGATLGGGCELALACDFVLASDDLKFGQPEITLGVLPPAAAALLPRLAGRQAAMDLILTGRPIGATEAMRLGLISRVFASGAFPTERDRVLNEMASLSGPALRLAKRAVLAGSGGSPDEALARAEELYRSELLRLPDAFEGIAAFLERRAPVWRAS